MNEVFQCKSLTIHELTNEFTDLKCQDSMQPLKFLGFFFLLIYMYQFAVCDMSHGCVRIANETLLFWRIRNRPPSCILFPHSSININ